MFSDRGFSASATIVKGMLYASKMGARITSNSYGGFEPDPAVEEAFRLSPALHVIAAGNDTENLDSKPNYPASCPIPNTVVVAATDPKDRLARFSSQTIQLRFRLTSDDHTTRDGFWMRNLLVSGESET